VSPQLVLAQLAPAAAVVLQQGEHSWFRLLSVICVTHNVEFSELHVPLGLSLKFTDSGYCRRCYCRMQIAKCLGIGLVCRASLMGLLCVFSVCNLSAPVLCCAGLSCIVLTMGSMGAALLTLSSHSRAAHSQPKRTSQQQQQQPLPQRSSGLSTQARALLLPEKAGGSGSDSQSHKKQTGRPGRLTVTAHHIPAAPASVVNLSGAGDTLTGGLSAALVRGTDPLHALAVGVAAARASVQCKLNVPGPDQGLVFEPVQQAALQLLKQQAVWEFPVSAAL
jgi:hypothetical protein